MGLASLGFYLTRREGCGCFSIFTHLGLMFRSTYAVFIQVLSRYVGLSMVCVGGLE